MATAADIQSLLRFLTQDAKTPLAVAISKAKELQTAGLTSPEAIAKSNVAALEKVFADPKTAKQVLAASKRVSKKRMAGDSSNSATSPTSRKKSRVSAIVGEPLTPAEIEASLALPQTSRDNGTLREVVLYTNRAPLVLAFAVTLLKYTMRQQPISSRLSLAQAVVSANSRSKAVSLGLEKGAPAEEEGWGQGRPTVKVMGREVRVLKRWGYEWREDKDGGSVKEEDGDENDHNQQQTDEEPALWGLDLEALRKIDTAQSVVNPRPGAGSDLPIYTPQSARNYLLKSFDTPPADDTPQRKKQSNAAKVAEKEHNLGLLLSALELLYESWSEALKPEELDSRAWGWYIRVRPEVEHGVAGWGGKGTVKLGEILDMRRKG